MLTTVPYVMTQVAEKEAARQKEKRKIEEKVHGCNDGGHAEGWCGREGCKE